MRSKIKMLVGTSQLLDLNEQQKEWYIATLLPHLRLPLLQQRIASQVEALEIVMKLEELLVQDTHVWVHQIQTQLPRLYMEIQYLKKGKNVQLDMCSEFWCIKCKAEGHCKDQCHVYLDYLATRGPNPLKLEPSAEPSTRLSVWCSIFLIA